jgi:hypothetical protein
VNRFEVLTAQEVKQRNLDPDEEWVWDEDDYSGYLVDNQRDEIVFCDAMEPEDAILGRHLDGLVNLLNKVAQGG